MARQKQKGLAKKFQGGPRGKGREIWKKTRGTRRAAASGRAGRGPMACYGLFFLLLGGIAILLAIVGGVVMLGLATQLQPSETIAGLPRALFDLFAPTAGAGLLVMGALGAGLIAVGSAFVSGSRARRA